MPMFDFECEVCGRPRRVWRPEGCPPRFCSSKCRGIGMRGYQFKEKYPVSEYAHDEIRRVYHREPVPGQVKDLAKRLRLPRWKITKYAIRNGWIAKQKKEPMWSDEELAALQKFARYTPEVCSRKMKERGFHRSATACLVKSKRLYMTQNLNGQSANSLAQCLGEDVHFVTRAIKRGDLRAKRRGTARTERQGGDMWYILDKDVKDFIVDNVNAIDLRKVDKHWVVDLLAT